MEVKIYISQIKQVSPSSCRNPSLMKYSSFYGVVNAMQVDIDLSEDGSASMFV